MASHSFLPDGEERARAGIEAAVRAEVEREFGIRFEDADREQRAQMQSRHAALVLPRLQRQSPPGWTVLANAFPPRKRYQLKCNDSIFRADQETREFVNYYNDYRPHRVLGYKTPPDILEVRHATFHKSHAQKSSSHVRNAFASVHRFHVLGMMRETDRMVGQCWEST